MPIDDQVRIRTLIRAMTDVVIPAIPAEAPLALEQAHLICSHLGLMMALSDYGYRLQLTEVAHFAELLRELVACVPGDAVPPGDAHAAQDLLRRAGPIVKLKVPDAGELRGLAHEVREAADQMLKMALSRGGETAGLASRIVLRYAERQILRERVAAKTAGFDADAAGQPDLKDVT
jgi:hypothetical protein